MSELSTISPKARSPYSSPFDQLPTEMLEAVLLQLGRTDVVDLARAREVCQRWNHTIHDSPSLQWELFLWPERNEMHYYETTLLLPDGSVVHSKLTEEEKLDLDPMPNESTPLIRINPLVEQCCKIRHDVQIQPADPQVSNYPHAISVDHRLWQTARFMACSEDMFLTQPPVINSFLMVPRGGYDYGEVVVDMEGLTLGEVDELVQLTARQKRGDDVMDFLASCEAMLDQKIWRRPRSLPGIFEFIWLLSPIVISFALFDSMRLGHTLSELTPDVLEANRYLCLFVYQIVGTVLGLFGLGFYGFALVVCRNIITSMIDRRSLTTGFEKALLWSPFLIITLSWAWFALFFQGMLMAPIVFWPLHWALSGS